MNVYEILETQDSRLNFLKGLIRVSKCDGVLDSRELSMYQTTATAFGLGADEMRTLTECWNTTKKIDVVFETPKQKAFFFIQVIQLCWIDEDYSETERKEVRKIADELCVNLKTIEAIEAWVDEGMKWNKKGEILLELE